MERIQSDNVQNKTEEQESQSHQSFQSFISDIDPVKALEQARVVFNPLFTGIIALLSVLTEAGKSISIFNKCGISTIASHVKNGKTKLIWMIAQILVSGKFASRFNVRLPQNSRIGLFDTEQGFDRTQATVNRCFPDKTGQFIDIYSIRHLSPLQMYVVIESYVMHYKPSVVFVDIASDLISGGVNDLSDSSNILNSLQKLAETYGTHFCLSIHLNKGDGQVTGHFGSLLLKKSELIITVKKRRDCFVVSPLFTRDEPFEPFGFVVEEGMASLIEEIPDGNKRNDRKSNFDRVHHSKHNEILNLVFREKSDLRPSEFKQLLQRIYAEKVENIGLLLTRELQRYYMERGYLKKNNGMLSLKTETENFFE